MPLLPTNKSLLEHTKVIIEKYNQDAGWKKLFNEFGLNFDNLQSTNDLANRLAKPLLIDTNVLSKAAELVEDSTAFQDLDPKAKQGIMRGWPSRSLLFHLFASPGVFPKEAELNPPNLAELEILENYVYVARAKEFNNTEIENQQRIGNSVNGSFPPSLDEIKTRANNLSLAVVTFAQQYRRGHETVHRDHADMCFSRTGVARAGNHTVSYDTKARGFWPAVNNSPHAICVQPVQYAPYVSVQLKGNSNQLSLLARLAETDSIDDDITPSDASIKDSDLDFWVPIHKIFDGKECIKGQEINLDWTTGHANEKIRRTHEFLRGKKDLKPKDQHDNAITDFTGFPFVVKDEQIAELSAETEHSHGLLVPKIHPLVEKTDVTFEVPSLVDEPAYSVALFSSSLEVRSNLGIGRPSPEYVYIRADKDGNDINSKPGIADDEGHNKVLLEPERRAAHYVDYSGDGWVKAECGIPLPHKAAYSLVTAPDFYPGVSQRELAEWSIFAKQDSSLPWLNGPKKIWFRDPDDLASDRYAANLTLQKNGQVVFENTDNTVTAVVSLHGSTQYPLDNAGKFKGGKFNFLSFPSAQRHAALPDNAAGVFYPGWDITHESSTGSNHDQVGGVGHFASYGLGSPFPEDAKLCAALSGFWPAAAPDTTRTFLVVPGTGTGPTQQHNLFISNNGSRRVDIAPMTDAEIGSDKFGSGQSWDGVRGPIMNYGNKTAELPSLFHADYVQNAAKNKFSLAKTHTITTAQYVRRAEVMERVRQHIAKDTVLTNAQKKLLRLVSFTETWDETKKEGSYKIEMALMNNFKLNGTSYTAQIQHAVRLEVTADNQITMKPIKLGSTATASPIIAATPPTATSVEQPVSEEASNETARLALVSV